MAKRTSKAGSLALHKITWSTEEAIKSSRSPAQLKAALEEIITIANHGLAAIERGE